MIEWKNNEAREAYQALVAHCISNPYEGYTERHHIVPRSMGGSDDQDNLVRMSAQNHLLAHYWLWVGTGAPEMGLAYWAMLNMNRAKMSETFKPTQEMLDAYESARVASAEAHSERMKIRMTGEKNHLFGKTGSAHHNSKKVLMKRDCGLTLSYGSAAEAGRCFGVTHGTITKRIKRGTKGFSYA